MGSSCSEKMPICPLIQVIIACGMLGIASGAATAQDMMRHLDMSSPEMTSAEMIRADVEAVIASAAPGDAINFTGKRLSGLDLSGLDLSGAVLRAANSTRQDLPTQSSTE